jgi:5-methylcytosine-specific restriction enzyme subunit McrC
MADPIPLRNIWLLFLYAADLVQFRDRFDNEVEAARDLPDLVARLLTHVVEDRLRRNLSRGYRPRSATLSRVRGRIDMLETSSHRLMDRGVVACRFEEHTMDTPRNRLVRAALEHLAARVRDDLVAHRCRQLAGDFSRMGVIAARPSRGELASDQIGRNETADRLMVALARIVFDTVIPSEEAGQMAGTLPDAQDRLIRHLFERAVGNALRLELAPAGWSVKSGRRLFWPVSNQSEGMASILPSMQTDIELNHTQSGRRIVIDTKFTAILTGSAYRDAILKSGYLYQLYAYLRTQERPDDPTSLSTEGMLLHPQTGGTVDEAMEVQDHKMWFKTIDLTLAPGNFELELRGCVSSCDITPRKQPAP